MHLINDVHEAYARNLLINCLRCPVRISVKYHPLLQFLANARFYHSVLCWLLPPDFTYHFLLPRSVTVWQPASPLSWAPGVNSLIMKPLDLTA